MSFSGFDGNMKSSSKARNDLRAAREEMLRETEARAKVRREREKPSSGLKEKLHKLSKKSKKKDRKKSKKRKKHSSSEDDSSSEEERKLKSKKRKKKYETSESSSESESGDEWVEKSTPAGPSSERKDLERDDWMGNLLLPTYQKEKKEPKKDPKMQIDSYDPSKSSRELNPYWKDGGGGLPSFQRPKDDEETESRSFQSSSSGRGNWKKKAPDPERPPKSPEKPPPVPEPAEKPSSSMGEFLTDAQMNELGAKIVKAEIMGNEELAVELKGKLERAREARKSFKAPERRKEEEVVVLTRTNASGMNRPLQASDPQGGGRDQRKKKRAETHVDGERVRYFPDDDKHDLKSMFEAEKFTSASDSDAQFARIAGASKKLKDSDNLEDIFSEQVRAGGSSDRDRDAAIREHQQTARALESCELCVDSPKMDRNLIVALGEKAYLALPWHEGLTPGHCIISSTQHVASACQTDEEVWEEMRQFRKSLTQMFAARKQDVVFFEIAKNLHRRPHLAIHCVPSGDFELAPMYFKKAIQESEREWSMNKQLVDLRKEKKDLRRAVPRNLPYFWVEFGMDGGFAHVIEEQDRFPSNFAQEVIGGLLNLDARLYRRPRKEHNAGAKVRQFSDWWKPYDFTRS